MRWQRWTVTVTTSDGCWQHEYIDPAEALASARTQMLAPAEPDALVPASALLALARGIPVAVCCADGAVITVAPTIPRKEP